MSDYSCFDIIGPVMVGPSSSHTAGAVRLGRFARSLTDGMPTFVDIQLHGSFAETYKGHGTDLAIISGLLGMDTDDVRIKDAYQLAEEAGLNYTITRIDLGDEHHANTVRFIMKDKHGDEKTVTGCSVGGGKIKIIELDNFEVDIEGEYPTIIDTHLDQPGAINQITGILANHKVNIASMRVFRQVKRTVAYMVIETDEIVSQNVIDEMLDTGVVVDVKFINPF
ncbi:MAG: L-serine ammonia-lyase, iron-sulfur-dependent subunit beta [Peptococcaceae bacterium]|nr:L-serine ammonia-lyase, iron-sulfur-dependent subunit beta [Peptococcaceae bacterium]